MQPDRTSDQIEFQGFGRRRVVGQFDAGRTSSDGGVLLPREVAERTGWVGRFAACFRDGRNVLRIEHTTRELVSQRVLGIALGYEDFNDHETLRGDALLALAAGKRDVTGAAGVRERDRCHALAGKSTLNRLEHGRGKTARYHRIDADEAAIERHFVDCMLDAHALPRGPNFCEGAPDRCSRSEGPEAGGAPSTILEFAHSAALASGCRLALGPSRNAES